MAHAEDDRRHEDEPTPSQAVGERTADGGPDHGADEERADHEAVEERR
jgi:hypothetical protein